MKTRILHTKIWKDSFCIDLTVSEKLLFLYFLTNEEMNILHIYECPDRKIIFDTGVTQQQLQIAKGKFSESGKIYFYKGYVYVKNADKYEDYSGDRYDKAKENLRKQIGDEIINYFLTSHEVVNEELETTSQVDIIHKTKTISHKSENRGIVKGEKITEEDMEHIAQDYKVPVALVRLQNEKMHNWMAAKGKRYKDEKRALRNWVLSEAQKTVEGRANDNKRGIDARGIN